MEEAKPKSRATRSRVASIDSENSTTNPKKSTRARKVKEVSENETARRRNSTNDEDYDDGASSTSSKSSHGTRSCKVVLRRENFDEIRNAGKEEEQDQDEDQDQDQDRAIAHATRNRRNSKLTEENVATLGNSAKRTLRSASVVDSDGTESTVSRARRTRLANSQIPKNDNNVAPATPTRRSSRLLSENEKAADSPAKTPAKRNLRSNSVASVDEVSPPTTRTRTSSRLAESQSATPKSLKTAVSKIKAEPTTPRRSSSRVNKSIIISEIIDEETSDHDDFDNLVAKQPNKLQQTTEIRNIIEEENEIAAEKEDAPLQTKATKDGSQQESDIEVKSTGEKMDSESVENELKEIEPREIQSTIDEELPTTEKAATPAIDSVKSPRNIRSPKVLISTSTAKTPNVVSPVQQKADTPSIEPAEPMETSMSVQAAQIKKVDTPKVAAKIMEKSKTPQKKSPNVKMSVPVESVAEPAIVNENPSSPETAKLNSTGSTAVEEKDQNEGEHSFRIELPSSANVSLDHANISNDFEPMDIDETLPEADKDTSLKEILKTYTPKTKSRVSSGFNSMDVTALAHEHDDSKQTPKPTSSKKPSKRVSLNDTTQFGFDLMEVSILASESTNNAIEKVKSSVPKDADEMKAQKPIKGTPSKNSNEEFDVEQSYGKRSKVETPKVKTPKVKTLTVDLPEIETPKVKTPTVDLLEIKTPKVKTPTVNLSEIETPKVETPKVKTPKVKTPTVNLPENETPKVKTPKVKTPTVDLLEIKTPKVKTPTVNLPEIETPKVKTPKAKTPTVNLSEIETPKVETPKVKTSTVDSPKVDLFKVQTPKSKTPTSKLSPRKTPVSISLNNEINKIIAGLETPVAGNEFEDRFSAIAKSVTPASSNSFVDKQFDEISSVLSPNAAKSAEKSAKKKPLQTDNSEDANKTVEKSINCDKNDDSTINETQSEVETTLPNEKPTKPKSDRKSVQIMTPQAVQRQSSEKRIDTPYPPASVIRAAASFSGIDGETKKPEDKQKDLHKLAESWSKSVKRNDLVDGSPKPIDKFGTDKTEKIQAKKAVPARNNWARGLIDSDTESETDEDFIVESCEEAESCSEEESENSMLENEAEEIEGYNTGDSMDEDERREIEDNKIEEQGEDIGSEDSEDEEMDEEYTSDDGFLVDDDKVDDKYSESEEEEIMERKTTNKRRSSRIFVPTDSEESDSENHQNADSNSSNDVVSISMETTESVVVIAGNAPNAEQIVEGKKFATTYLTTEDEEMSTSTRKSETSQPKTTTVETESVEDESLPDEENVEKESESTDNTATEMNGDENTPQSLTVQLDGKESKMLNEKIVNKKQRTSLPGINRLANAVKQVNRTSLGDLYPNRQKLRVGFVESDQKKAKISVKKRTIEMKNDENNSVKDDNQTGVEPAIDDDVEHNTNTDMNASSSSSGNVSSRKNTPLNVSSQEENNNQKISDKKSKTTQKTRVSEIIPINSDIALEATTATPEAMGLAQNTPTTGLNENKNKKSTKSKRKFEEIDADEEPYERPKAKKLLKIVSTASGGFIEEPMTPEKANKHGFQVTPLTPVNPSFQVQKRATNKRKSIYMDEDEAEAAGLLLPKPRWQINTQFERQQPRKRARKLELGSSEVIIQPIVSNNKKVKFSISTELRQFRHQQMYREGIPRQDARALLREKAKKKSNYK